MRLAIQLLRHFNVLRYGATRARLKQGLVITLVIYTLHFLYKGTPKGLFQRTPNAVQETELSETRLAKSSYTIMWYRPYHKILRSHIAAVDMKRCKFQNCRILTRKSPPSNGVFRSHSNAILLQANNIAPGIVERTTADQVLVFVGFEPPTYLHSGVYKSRHWDAMFNWTMSYRLDSDIPYTYGSLTEKNPADIHGRDYFSIFRRKTRSVAWVVSHCRTDSRREEYVARLQDYIQVDVFGACGTINNCSWTDQQTCFEHIAKTYKFYLAFENSLCLDYITEKAYFWSALDIVTVVRGPQNYDHHLPAGTYIDTSEFSSIRELANFLLELARDERRYSEYLHRKDQYRLIKEQDRAQSAYCQLCERLNSLDKYRKSYKSMADWWDANGTCRKAADII